MWPVGRTLSIPAVAKLVPVHMPVIWVNAVQTCIWHHLPDIDFFV